jgi:SAM-dependent methyltransferase
MTTSVFDETAGGFALAADSQLQEGCYYRGDLFVAAARSFVPEKGRILDYGCGPGRISALLAREGFSVLGLDPSPAMIAAARQQRLDGVPVEFQQCSKLPQLPPQDTLYDAIVCSSVLEYVTKPEELLRSFASALTPTGVLIVSFANSRSLWRQWRRFRRPSPFLPVQAHTWSRRQFSRVLVKGGFTPAPTVYFDSPLDGTRLAGSPLVGTLGFVVARKIDAPRNVHG